MDATAAPIRKRQTMTTLRGITFPAPDTAESADAERPTTPTVRGIVTDAVRGSDAALAARVEGAKNWREAYLAAVRDLTMTTASTPQAAVDIARAGLDSAYRRMRVVGDDGHETPLAEWAFDDAVEAAHGTYEIRTIDGRKPRVEALAVPYKGRDLTGHDLERQLDTWVAKGVIEASCAEAVKRVINHPEWLSLPGHVLASVGAGAEMGPTDMLSRWGARILAVDIPRVSERLAKFAEAGAGSITLPVSDGEAGADIVADPAGVAAWFADNAGDDTIVFGMHAYADSGMHIRLTLAADAIGQYLQRMRPTTVLAYLATPTDAFVVPQEIVDASRGRWQRHGSRGVAKKGLRLASRGQLFSEPYPKHSHVADCLVAQQGPNYAVAKRLQRWRAVAAEADGKRVSFNVAPATLTRSVTKNPVLRAAYGGAHHFGVEVFASETSRALMAALLVHDVMRDDLAPGEAPHRDHPEALFSDGAAHGGLWRTAWAPRSALGVAAMLGLPKVVRR